MKRFMLFVVAAGMFFCVLAPEQASAQLFRRLWEDDTRNNYSVLPGADPYTRREPDYGAEHVSVEIRNEVNGLAYVGAAPDFMSDAPLALVAKQYQNPVDFTTQRPIENANQQQPPRSKYNNQITFGPHWLKPYSVFEDSSQSHLVVSEEMPPQSDSEPELNPTVEL